MGSTPPIPELQGTEPSPPLVRLEKHLGVTGVGSLWLGRLLEGNDAGRVVTARRIERRWLSDEDVTWAMNAARAYERVRHPSLVKLISVFEQGNDLLCISEHLEGVRLLDLLQRVIDEGVPLPATVATRIVLDAARATWKAHALSSEVGLFPAERLFLPEGVLLTSYGGTLLTEVGMLATLARSMSTRCVPELLGQLAPEELGAQTEGGSSPEVFSLGVLLWELLANRWLFSRDRESQTHHELLTTPIPNLNRVERFGLPVPEAMVKLVQKATERDPSQRFSSVNELANALGRLPAHFIASERQVLEVLRQRASEQLRESGGQLSNSSLSETITQCHPGPPTLGDNRALDEGWDPPDTATAEHWDKPTFAQRSLVSSPPLGTSVNPVCTTNKPAALGDSHGKSGLDQPPSQRRTGLLITTLTMLCTAGLVFLAREVPYARLLPIGRGSAAAASPLSAQYLPRLLPRKLLTLGAIVARAARRSALAPGAVTPMGAPSSLMAPESLVQVGMDTVRGATANSAKPIRRHTATRTKTTKGVPSAEHPLVDTRWGI